MRFLRLLSTAVLTAIGFAALAQSSGTAALSVTVDGLRNNNGTVIVAAFDQAKAFEAMDMAKAAAIAQIPASGPKVAVTFHNLPRGSYAFAALHDENLDGDLGMNGDVPTEGYAFAAMGRRGLPSKFEDASVAAGGAAHSILRLKYWN
ncbi:DUF2141 domain-containing protein [Primorskyibacter sp. S87]|uniref:DUF2141 domain-containing protein n=1 Tax=Primorskyibacter sp. S87 TaxID=3415126 RepID=UPI003C7A01A3